ncbi:MAG: sugar-binding domain-containing protein [Lentisphaeria bacterium]
MTLLNGPWKIALDPANAGRRDAWFAAVRPEAQPATVPGVIQQVFPDRFGMAWYWTTFTVRPTAAGRERVLLTFGAVDYLAEVWVNGRPVGGHEGGETPFTLDITGAVTAAGENLLAVRVLNPSDADDPPPDGIRLVEIPHRHKTVRNYAPGRSYNFGGILGPVEVQVLPAVRIIGLHAQPDAATGRIRVEVTVRNDTPRTVRGRLAATAGLAAAGETVAVVETTLACAPGDSVHTLDLTLAQVRLWDLDSPNLYTVRASLETRRAGVHEQACRCGFRELRVERGYFRLNGRRLFLRSTHTCNHFPIGQQVPMDPDLMRRDLLMAKVSGYNMVRFIAGMAFPEQLDCCDEIGLMVYEECQAGWELADSPEMARRYDLSVREMILRDRNHPCITVWGLLNETPDGPVFRHAVAALPGLRDLDDSRLVLLSSGRWDNHPEIGSLSNPGHRQWDYEWGIEAADAVGAANATDANHGGYFDRSGDAHVYPVTPHPPATFDFIRNLGRDSKPVFLSEYGTGSLLNVIRGTRHFEQRQTRPDLADATLFREMTAKLEADWRNWGFDGVYPFPEDMLVDSERLHSRQRLLGFDLVRANPQLCGFNLTGMLDHGITGEGAWTFWREWKPGVAEALADGWAPLRWCLFAAPSHVYAGRPCHLEAVLATEDVLPPGEYPATLRVHGPGGVIWEEKRMVVVPPPPPGGDGPLAVPVFDGDVVLDAPPGAYTFAATLDRGGAPAGGRLRFHLAVPPAAMTLDAPVALWGVAPEVAGWLARHGVATTALDAAAADPDWRQVVLVGADPEVNDDAAGWRALLRRLARGDTAIFLSPKVFIAPTAVVNAGRLKRTGEAANDGNCQIAIRHFEVANAPPEDWEVFSHEFWGRIHYALTGLPAAEYTLELGLCEGYFNAPGQRVFDVVVNGETVLPQVDIIREAGGPRRAVVRTVTVRPDQGRITVEFLGHVNGPSLSRLRLYDRAGHLVQEDTALAATRSSQRWLPLPAKGNWRRLGDWLYHKECVAKTHPVFAGLQAGGVMDWEYYGPVISHTFLEGATPPDTALAAAFATGYCTPGGYAAGIMLGEYRLGAGRFILNAFNLLDQVGTHPAADRLLLNLLQYAAAGCREPLGPVAHFDDEHPV